MSEDPILCEHNPPPAKLEVLGVEGWPVWKKDPSRFDWTYHQKETCYIVRGKFSVTPRDGGETQHFKRGDLISFPAGMTCTWEVTAAVEKHYRLD